MQGNTPQVVHGHLQEHLKVKRWRYVVTALACIVVFCTTYALILPGTAMTGETYCGKEAHVHTDACYERVLACGLEETQGTDAVPAHAHTDACYETVSTLVCGQEEQPAHTHGAECYTSESTLTCGLEEGDDHTHDESCYTQTETLTCGLEETQGHTHDESCYQTEQHLVCGQEETEGTPAVEGHTHTDACYENRLACQLEEHEHTLACYSNPQADVESSDVWERTLPQDLGDNWAENVVAVAKSQLGYVESTANYEVGEDNAVYGYTRYGAWYGMPYADWCAMFASFCLNYAGVPQSAVPFDSGCSHWVEQLQNADLYAGAADCTPQAGYLVFFDTDGDAVADHVGVVTEVVQQEGGFTVKTVEGNSGDAVAAREYSGGDGSILGYCILPKNPDSTADDRDASDGDASADGSDTSTEDPAVISVDEAANGSDGAALVSDEVTESISAGETKTLSVAAGQIVKLSFVPQYTHQYVFYSSAKADTFGYLYDANGKRLTSDDESGGNGDFKIAYSLTAGETYYWGVKWYSSSKSGDIPVTLELGDHSYAASDDQVAPVCVCGAVCPLSGTCGADLQWSFDSSTGTLTISGTGNMTNYSRSGSSRAPWAAFSDLISSVVVEDGATSIGSFAFYNCASLNSVTLPASLKSIEYDAFARCTSLQSADLSGTSLTSIDQEAFSGCTSLQSADLSGTSLTSIGQMAFYNCSSLSSASFPASLESIGAYAFLGCSALQSADLSATRVASIGKSAFSGCTSLGTVAFPASLASIGEQAFYNCASLQSADLSGTSLTSIGGSAFWRCTTLGTVSFPSSLTSIGASAFSDCTSLQSADLSGTSLTSVGSYAFSDCTSLSSASFPASLESIGNYAFCRCTSLQSADLSGTSLTSVGLDAFYNCSSLGTVTFPASLASIGTYAFYGCTSLQSADLSGTSLTSVDSYAFSGCTSLSSASFPASLTSIEGGAFSVCTSLQSVDLSATGVTSLGKHAFNGCSSLGTVSFPASLESIGQQAFYGCTSLQSVDLSATGVTSIDAYAFACSYGAKASLRSIVFPGTLESIGDYAFRWCVSLESVDLSATQVSSIGKEAFSECTSLSEFVTPTTPVSVGQNAFTDCRELAELRLASADVTLNSSQSATGARFHVSVANTVDVLASDDVSVLASMGCDSISFEGPGYLTITGSDWQADFLPDQLKGLTEGDYFIDAQGVWYRIDATSGSASVFYCPAGIATYTVAKELPAREEGGAAVPVTGVDSFAFGSASDLTNLDFESPDTVTVLSDRAFAGATNLQSINGKSTAGEVLATFTAEGLDTGTMLFWKTKIAETDSGLTGNDIVIAKDNLTLTVSTTKSENTDPAQSDEGVFNYYTGESATTTITVSSDSAAVEDGAVVRVYFQFDSKSGNLNYKTGEYPVVSSTGNTYTMTVFKTDTENCYCVEFERTKQGDTLSITLESSYPSPTSAGGSALLWASILTAEEKAATGSKATVADAYQSMNWTTVVDTFPVTKKRSSTSLSLCGDGVGGAYLDGLSYDISMKREGSTLEGMGKDFMTSVTFEDVLTLPEGVTLADDVVQSIKDGTVRIAWNSNEGYGFYTSANRLFLRITPNPQSNYTYMRNGAVSLNDDGKLVLRWTFVNSHLNSNPSSEIDDLKFTYRVWSNTLIVKDPQPKVTYTLHNAVTATQHFMHSADQVQASECDVTTSEASSSLTLYKDQKKPSYYYGGSKQYLITAKNPGALPYEGLAYLTDDLPTQLYMRPADLASAFGQDESHQLTVTIKNASICASSGGTTVAGMDGAGGTTDSQYSGQNTTYNGKSYADPDSQSSTATLTVCWDGDALKISVDGGAEATCAADEASMRKALQQLGFVVNSATQYCLSWDLRSADGSVPSLPGGATIEKTVPCAVKDTFMLLDGDTDNQYPTQSFWVSNTARAENSTGAELKSYSSSQSSSSREFSLNKSWSLGGASIDEGTAITQGDVLDYSLAVTHQSSDAYYDALPLADRMAGAQALMVPADKNSGASWADGAKTVTHDGVEYYVLNTPGTYSNVWTSDTQLADSVQVTATDAGLDTLIKWYFVDYTGSRSDTVSYKAYVCPGEVLADGATTFALNNESWLGDRASHRLYATVPGYNGTTFDFNKEIVDSADDSAQGYQYSLVAEGQTVIYRLTLDGSVVVDGEARTMTISGASMYDALPLSTELARWSKDANVKVAYGTGATVTNGDSWSVTAADEKGQQNIVWGSDFSVTFSGKAYIYVELTFPSGDAWLEYANAYGASILANSYHVYDAQRYVTHELQVAATARLQKGVLDTGYFGGSGSWSYYTTTMDSEDDRLYYQNDDAQIRGVKYYVTLYNAGPTNLYLTDMQDLLPHGFTYNYSTSFSTTTGTISVKNDDGSDASQRNAYVSATTSSAADGRQVVTFHFRKYAYDYSVAYDESREMCYLKPGECLSFYYTCRTNGAADTDNAALNAIAMPYYDFNDAGVVVDEACAITPKNSATYTPNDGGCEVLVNADAQAQGYTGGETGTQWLASDVTVVRGEIKPGITKELTSKTDQNGTTTFNPTWAASTDTLNWTLLAENDGSGAVADYVLTDRMQSPYMFVGNVSCSVYSSASKTVAVAEPYTGGYLFTIGKPADDGTLPITTNSGNTYSLTVGGDPVTMSCAWKYNVRVNSPTSYLSKTVEVQLSIAKDADGYAVMSLYLPDAAMAIPEAGHIYLSLSTYNETNTLANKQFINTCFVTPLSQSWDNTTNKGNVTTLETPFAEGALSSVRNSAPVTTTYGYATSSSKSVAEVGNEGNEATCTTDPNYIVLADSSKQFRYTLTVDNTTSKAMDRLILIDNLPEVGDHTTFLTDDPRFSEFKVSLAADPGFSVVVTTEDDVSTVLDASAYSIEYSTATEFTSQDWNGTSAWSSDAQGARSVRLVIDDATASLIPAKSTISLSFTCQIDGDVEPGQIAWNSFGYHYGLDGEVSELEAAPLKVGVKVPAVPELRKQVVDHSGQARAVDADATFSFLVYPGTALKGAYSTYEEWVAALEAAGVAYDTFTATVKAGESLSDSVRMVTTKWEWTDGQKYNVVELPCGDDYAFKRFQGSASKSYTLTYNASQVQVVTCENVAQRWSIELLKQNTSGTSLAGAVFALYSPDAADGLAAVPEGYADLDIALTLEHGGATWYLASVQTTPDSGELAWADLLRDQYYLLEAKAPDGYNRNDPAGQVLKRDKETQGTYSLTVTNRSGYSLPETGGPGTYPYTMGGLVLLAGAVGLLASRLARQREEDRRTA